MDIEAELIGIFDTGNTLGEGVLWRSTDQSVWWTDIEERQLLRLSWPTGKIDVYHLPERLCSFGFVKGDDSRLVCAFESGFGMFSPETGQLDWLVKPAELGDGRRLNDGRVSPDGSFWAGSMSESGGDRSSTGLYRLNRDGSADRMIFGIGITNGLCWSPAGEPMYVADSASGKIFTCPPDRSMSDITACNVFASVEEGAPDGAVTDAAGRYWSAIWGAAQVRCYGQDGQELRRIALPAYQPTCLAFGGPDNDLLFVTSARIGMDTEKLRHYPNSGSLFVLKTNACGSPNFRYCPKA